jgi:hypothetical protein
LVQKQIHLEGVQLGQCSGFVQGIKGWALVSALCATDAMILVDLGDLPACAFRGLPEFAFLIQVYPKDLRALPGHPEPAVSWSGRFREGGRMLDLSQASRFAR